MVAAWEMGEGAPDRSYKALLWRLGGLFVALYLASSVTYSLQKGSEHDSSVLNVLDVVLRASWVIVLCAFVIVLLMSAGRRLGLSRGGAKGPEG